MKLLIFFLLCLIAASSCLKKKGATIGNLDSSEVIDALPVYNITMYDAYCTSYYALATLGEWVTFSNDARIIINYWSSITSDSGSSFLRSPNPPYQLGFEISWSSNDGMIASFLTEDSEGCYWAAVGMSDLPNTYNNGLQISIIGSSYCGWSMCT